MNKFSDTEYRDRSPGSMEQLASTLYPNPLTVCKLTDDELIDRAVTKIKALQKIALACGVTKEILTIIMES